MAHVTGTDLQDLQFDSLGTSTAGNPQLPASAVPALNKALKTSGKTVIAAINEVLTLAQTTNNSFSSFSAFYNDILGDANTNPADLTNAQKVDANVLLAIVKLYREIHGPDLDAPVPLPVPYASIAESLTSYDASILAINATLDNKLDVTASVPVSQIDSLQTLLDAKLDANASIPTSQVTGLDTALSQASPSGHTHNIADVNLLQDALDAIQSSVPLTTNDLPEGLSNLYFTTARVLNFLDSIKNLPSSPVFTDASGKIPMSLIGASGLSYKGTYDALTNTPAIDAVPASDTNGYWYKVAVAGTFNGLNLEVNDWLISNGTSWEQVDNTDKVTSVFGRLGAVQALESDYASFYASLTGNYADPSWIMSLDGSKITGRIHVSQLGSGTADATKVLKGDGTWDTIAINPGTVTSVGLAMPLEMDVAGGDITDAGSFVVTWKAQTARTVFAAPASSDGLPSFRILEESDIPGLDASKIISGTLSDSAIPDLDAAKITSGQFGAGLIPGLDASKIISGTLDSSLISGLDASQVSTGTFAMTQIPDLDASKITTGTIDVSRIPDLDAAKIASGFIDLARLGSGTPDSSMALFGDGAWKPIVMTGGTVTSVGLDGDGTIFDSTGTAITSAGNLGLALRSQGANAVLVGPSSGTGLPTFRNLEGSDIPGLDGAKITTGTVATSRLGTGIGTSMNFLRGDGVWSTIPVAGTVTSVSLSMPPELDVTGSPVTSAGSLTASWASQNEGLVFAGPVAGSGTPGFRLLVGNDIPGIDASKIISGVIDVSRLGSGTADSTKVLLGDGTWGVASGGTITSVGLIAPSAEMTVIGSPITENGSFELAWKSQSAGLVFAGPSAVDGVPSFRLLVADDIPALDAAKITSGILSTSVLGSGSADSTKVLLGDGTWGLAPGGTVTSVGLDATSVLFAVSGSPVTSAGNLVLNLVPVSAHAIFAGPTTGSSEPSWRQLESTDIPDLDAAKIASGVIDVSRLGTGTPDSSKVLLGDGSWGTSVAYVSSVGLSLPSIFNVSGSPVTDAGTLSASLASQGANSFFAAPNGSAGAPSFRAITPADLGTGTANATTVLRGDGTWGLSPGGTVTSVSLTMPSLFNVSGAPVTSAGTIAVAFADVAAGKVFASPSPGSPAGPPVWRTLVSSELPGIDASKIVSGVLPPSRLGVGAPDATKVLTGDGAWSELPSGITSVGLTVPSSILVSSQAVVTSAGSFDLTLQTQPAKHAFLGPIDGAEAVPDFRAIEYSDIKSAVDARPLTDMASGSPDAGTFMRGDKTWAVPQYPESLGVVSGASTIPVLARYVLGSALAVTAASWTPVVFGSKDVDTMSFYNTTTGRFQPTLAGFYRLDATIEASASADLSLAFYKNGVIFSKNKATGTGVDHTDTLYLNGTTDYVTTHVMSSADIDVVHNTNGSFFSGFQLVQPATPTSSISVSPAIMRMTLGSAPVISAETWTKIYPTVQTYVTAMSADFDTGTGRFKPKVSGFYSIEMCVGTQFPTLISLALARNSVNYSVSASGASDSSHDHSDRVFLNGTTDYVEFYVKTGMTLTLNADTTTFVSVSKEPNANNASDNAQDYVKLSFVYNSNGPACTAGWNTQPLNVKDADTGSICSFSAATYQFTLQPGSYRVCGTSTASQCGQVALSLYSLTSTSHILTGTSVVAPTSILATGVAKINGSFSIAVPTTFEIRRWHQAAYVNGFGNASLFPAVYAQFEFWRDASSSTDSVTALSVSRPSAQTLVAGTPTLVDFSTVDFDTRAWWNTTTKKYVPMQAGHYSIVVAASVATGTARLEIVKNAVTVWTSPDSANPSGTYSVMLDGRTDTISLKVTTSEAVSVGSALAPVTMQITKTAAVMTQPVLQSVTAIRVHNNGVNFNTTNPILWSTVEFDNLSEYNSTTGRFTPKTEGFYLVTAAFIIASGSTLDASIYKNGVLYSQGQGIGSVTGNSVSALLRLTTSDYVTVGALGVTVNGNPAYSYMTIHSVLGQQPPTQIAGLGTNENPTVPNITALRVHRNGVAFPVTASTATNAMMTTVEFDAQTEYTLGTNRFSPKTSGYYNVMFQAKSPDDSFAQVRAMIYKNGTLYTNGTEHSATVSVSACASSVIYLTPTDYVEPWVWTSGTSVSGLATETSFSVFSVNAGTGVFAPAGMMWPSVTALRVHCGKTNISVATSTSSKLNLTTVETDSNSEWSTSLKRWSPKVAGYYAISLSARTPGGTLGVYLYKNGVGFSECSYRDTLGAFVSCVAYVTPSDYIEPYVWSSNATITAYEVSSGAKSTVFSVYSVNSVALSSGGGGGGGSGSVTSIGLDMPSMFVVRGSPISSTGQFQVALEKQVNNTALLGPLPGVSDFDAPTFRRLDASDIGTGAAGANSVLRGDMTWQDASLSIVTASNASGYTDLVPGSWNTLSFDSFPLSTHTFYYNATASRFDAQQSGYYRVAMSIADPTMEVGIFLEEVLVASGFGYCEAPVFMEQAFVEYQSWNSNTSVVFKVRPASGVTSLSVADAKTKAVIINLAESAMPVSTKAANFRGMTTFSWVGRDATNVSMTSSTPMYPMLWETTFADGTSGWTHRKGTDANGVPLGSIFKPKVAGYYRISYQIVCANLSKGVMAQITYSEDDGATYSVIASSNGTMITSVTWYWYFNGVTSSIQIRAMSNYAIGTFVSAWSYCFCDMVVADQMAAVNNAVACSALLSSQAGNLTVLPNTWTKLALTTTSFDQGNDFKTGSELAMFQPLSSSLRPTHSGFYSYSGYIAEGPDSYRVAVYKNGTVLKRSALGSSAQISGIIDMDGISDVLELYGYSTTSSIPIGTGTEKTCLQANLVTGALSVNDTILTATQEVTTASKSVVAGVGVYRCDALNQPIGMTLPEYPRQDEQHVIKKIDGSSNAVTVLGNGKLIDGQSSVSLTTQYQVLRLRYAGTSWDII